ncbi:MAG: hypothetical protein HRU31_08205 [Rhodobacteraceae bacterium]|nr:hypothetical protein [Paracoccaceae bacterium]
MSDGDITVSVMRAPPDQITADHRSLTDIYRCDLSLWWNFDIGADYPMLYRAGDALV